MKVWWTLETYFMLYESINLLNLHLLVCGPSHYLIRQLYVEMAQKNIQLKSDWTANLKN